MKNALIAICLILICSPALADEREQLVGVWKLQTYYAEFQDTGESKEVVPSVWTDIPSF